MFCLLRTKLVLYLLIQNKEVANLAEVFKFSLTVIIVNISPFVHDATVV